MRWILPLPLVGSMLALAACDKEPSPEEQARADAAASAEVRAASVAPPVPVSLDPIAPTDIEDYDIIGVGCNFLLEQGAQQALAVTLVDEAFVKRGEQMQRLAPDTGSPKTPFGTWTKYSGGEFALELALSGEGEQVGMETSAYDATLTLRDGRDRVLMVREGVANCGS